MATLKPIYTAANTTPAYQLNWSLDLFWRQPSADADAFWLPDLTSATELDHVRILNHRFVKSDVSQFLLSTRPEISPQAFARSVKGRLQHLLRHELPKAFSRNYCFRSLGSGRREAVERYVDNQLRSSRLADFRTENRLASFQIHNTQTNLASPRTTGHSLYWYNLHLVLVNEGRTRDFDSERLFRVRGMVERVCAGKGFLLSRAGILPDHLHLTLGCPSEKSPQEVALCFMNNLAYAYGMQSVFQCGYFVGTFGEYDLGAVHGEPIIVPPAQGRR